MRNFFLKAEKIKKTFDGKQTVFNNIDIEFRNNDAIGLTGRNGSGKSTLLKMLAGLISPSSGNIVYQIDDKVIKNEDFNNHYGFVSPYLNLYEEFTAVEHIKIYLELKGLHFDATKSKELLSKFGLSGTGGKYISKFSSGMKQRMKFILALVHEPCILFLDEPFTNLDEYGINIVEKTIEEHLKSGGAVVIASNDEREKSFCKNFINLE